MIFLYDTSKTDKPSGNFIMVEIPPELDDIAEEVGAAIPMLRGVGRGHTKIWNLIGMTPVFKWRDEDQRIMCRLGRYIQPHLFVDPNGLDGYVNITGFVPDRLWAHLREQWGKLPSLWESGTPVAKPELVIPTSRFEREALL